MMELTLGTYDIGGMIMTHEQVEAIAQKHVNEVLAEINEKVEREKERIEKERIERETKLREKQEEKDAAREKAAQEKAEKEKIKAEHREQKAEEKRQKEEEKRAKDEAKAAEKRKKEEELAAEKRKKEEELAAERKRKEDELNAQKELNAVQKELALGEGVSQHDAQMEQKESAQSEPKASSEGLAEAVQANTGVNPETVDEDGKGKGIKSWFKTKVGRRLSRNAQDMEPAPTTASGSKTESKSKEDLYGTFPVASNWIEPSRPREESLRDVALAKHTDDVPSETHEEPVEEEDHEIDDIAGYKPEGYETPEYVSEDEKFDDAVEEFKEGSSPTSVAKEAEKKVSVDKGSRFKEEF
jgi:myosin heavy subunit